MLRNVFYIVSGYLCGSILFARVAALILQKGDITVQSADGNPGTANAFLYGGFWCGLLTLCGDLLKGFLPVQMYLKDTGADPGGIGLLFVVIAPVMGHIFSVFNGFHGGKGIAVTFGCLLGLYPDLRPALVLAFFFLFFSLVVRITPHCDRTVWAYRCAVAGMFLFIDNFYVSAAFLVIALAVNLNLRSENTNEEKCRVRILWRH